MARQFATFQITVEGWLDETWADYLGNLDLSAKVGEGRVNETTLRGRAPDVAAFVSIVTHMYDVGFNILSLRYDAATVELAVDSHPTNSSSGK